MITSVESVSRIFFNILFNILLVKIDTEHKLMKIYL